MSLGGVATTFGQLSPGEGQEPGAIRLDPPAGTAAEEASRWEAAPADSAEVAGGERGRVGVMVLAVDEVDAVLAEGLGELLLAAIAREDRVRLVGKEEIQAALGHDDAASLGCLASPACLGRLGERLGLDQLVAVTLARTDRGFAFDLGRYDPRTGTLRVSTSRLVSGTDGGVLAEAMLSALARSEEPPAPELARLLVRVTPEAAAVSIDDRDAAVDTVIELTAGLHQLRVTSPGFVPVERSLDLVEGELREVDVVLSAQPRSREPPILPPDPFTPVAAAVGGVGVAAGGLTLVFGLRSRREISVGSTRAEAIAHVQARRRDARVANAGLSVGAAALVATVVAGALAWRAGRARRARVSAGPLAGGFVMGVEVRR